MSLHRELREGLQGRGQGNGHHLPAHLLGAASSKHPQGGRGLGRRRCLEITHMTPHTRSATRGEEPPSVNACWVLRVSPGLLSCSPQASEEGRGEPALVSPGGDPGGNTSSEHTARWWQRQDLKPGGGHGKALLSRVPMLPLRGHPAPGPGARGQEEHLDPEPRTPICPGPAFSCSYWDWGQEAGRGALKPQGRGVPGRAPACLLTTPQGSARIQDRIGTCWGHYEHPFQTQRLTI